MLRLAWRGVVRNWDRTALGVLGMALAAAILSGALALQRGFPSGADEGARALIGGDVIVLAGKPLLSQADLSNGSWVWRPATDSYRSDLPLLFPGNPGGIEPSGAPSTLSAADLRYLAHLPGVVAVRPDLAMPALTANGREVVLRGRVDTRFIRYGRALRAGDRDVAVVDAVTGPPPPSLTVRIPRLAGDGPVWDYGHLITAHLKVVGGYALPADQSAQQVGPDGQPVLGVNGIVQVPAYWPSPDVWIPATTWRRLWHEVAPATAFQPSEAALVLKNTLAANSVVAAAARGLPAATVLTVPELAAVAGDRFTAGPGERMTITAGRSAGRPLALSGLAAVLGVVVAGLGMAGNLLLLVASRRREIGVLKALGAGPLAVAGMVAAEAAGFAVIGGVLGFAAVRLVVTAILLASHAGAGRIVLGGLREGALVVGISLAAAVVCGGLPALEAAMVPAAEVLREEGGR